MIFALQKATALTLSSVYLLLGQCQSILCRHNPTLQLQLKHSIWEGLPTFWKDNTIEPILAVYCVQSCPFSKQFQICTYFPKFSNILPSFNISLPFFWKITPTPLPSKTAPLLVVKKKLRGRK